MLIVNVMGFGDFDMKYLDSTWSHDVFSSLKDAGLCSSMFEDESDPNYLISKLKELGFKRVKTSELNFGGNL